MSIYELTLFIHIILFCYWLGGDVGVFYSSKFVVDSSLPTDSRLLAAKIMLGCDLIPRICMSLMLTVGGLLSHYMGIEHPTWLLIAIVLLGPIWLSLVLILHFKHHASFVPLLTKIDFYFRCAVIAAIIGSCIYAFQTNRMEGSHWILIKLIGFGFLVFCGLMIRINLKDFINTYSKLLNNIQTVEDDNKMVKSLNLVRPWVITIWIVLSLEAVVGIVKPF
jgi:hypothetical protein